MKKTTIKTLLWLAAIVLPFIAGTVMTACDDDLYGTGQMKSGTHLNSFGPSPVARGGELRFIGTGLDAVTSVEIPGCAAISDIKRTSSTEIGVTVPQEAEPGYVTLNYNGGKITTQTMLTYSEPISLEEVTPAKVKAGDEVIIKGDYLNLIAEVIFEKDVVVTRADFTAQTRKEIRLAAPAEARTGKVIISDGAEIPNMIYSAEAIELVLPAVEEVIDLADAMPGETMTIEGTDLDLVTSVIMPNGDAVDFTLEEGKINFVLPANLTDGTITVYPASEVSVPVANVVVVVPSDLTVTPASGLRGKDVITINGENLNQVATVSFPGVDEAVELATQSDTEITVEVPDGATDGDIILNLNSGKTVTETITMAKPADLAYDQTSIPAGNLLTVTGSNLDLVVTVTFGGDTKAEPVSTTASSLTVNVPTTAESGTLTFVMANGMSVEGPQLTVEKPQCAWISALPERFLIGQTVEMPLENADVLTSVTINGNPVEYIRINGNLMMVVPDQPGLATLLLTSSNGSISYNISIESVETVIFEGPVALSWADDGRFGLAYNFFENCKPGSKLIFYLTQNANWGQIQVNDGGWATIASIGAGGYITTDFIADKSATKVTIELTQENIDAILATQGNYWGVNTAWQNGDTRVALVLQGQDLTIDKITIIY